MLQWQTAFVSRLGCFVFVFVFIFVFVFVFVVFVVVVVSPKKKYAVPTSADTESELASRKTAIVEGKDTYAAYRSILARRQ